MKFLSSQPNHDTPLAAAGSHTMVKQPVISPAGGVPLRSIERDHGRAAGTADAERAHNPVERNGSAAHGILRDRRVPLLPVISSRAFSFAAWRAGRTLSRHFSRVMLSQRGAGIDLPDLPVLVYCNDPSVWTPTLGLFLAAKLWPSWRHYAPADARRISRFSLRAQVGFQPVTQDRSGVMSLMRTARHVLMCPGHMYWMASTPTPTDPRQRPTPIDPVLVRLARRFDDILVLPIAIEHPFGQDRRPEALVRLGEPLRTLDAGRRSQHGWHTLLERRLQQTMDRLSEQARDPKDDAFEVLLDGR
jgi:hypothetical protein